MKNNIILIGMPGVGKSSVGVVLAKALGYHFVDSDLVIQQTQGKLLCEIIEEYGNDGFLQIENRINSGIDVDRTVLATGGSAVYGREAMEHFKNIGTVLYMKAEYDTINSRLSNLVGRGVAMKSGQTLRDLYEERSELYEKYADITVVVDNMSIEEIISNILKKYVKNG